VKKDPKVFLEHIMDSILLIEEYAKNVSQAEFFKNRHLQDAIIRRLEIIGEAVKNLPMTFRSKNPKIPWKQIAGMRDILIHEYFDVDLMLTWKVVKQELPMIKKSLSSILAKKSKSSI
jgi:uncharacterized protein with HEPN domain